MDLGWPKGSEWGGYLLKGGVRLTSSSFKDVRRPDTHLQGYLIFALPVMLDLIHLTKFSLLSLPSYLNSSTC